MRPATMLINLRALGGVLLLACSLATSFAESSFTGLGFLPGGRNSSASAVSGDGLVVVGESESRSAEEKFRTRKAFRWTAAGGMGFLPDGGSCRPYAVSSDGKVVVGGIVTYPFHQAFRWTAASGTVLLKLLPGWEGGEARGVSGDGKVVIGWNQNSGGDDDRAFLWTAAGGMASLGILPGTTSSAPYAVSSDGKVVVGACVSLGLESFLFQAFRWTAATRMVGLGFLPGGSNSFAKAVSSDGKVVVGTSTSASGRQAFRWTAAGGMVGLGHPLGERMEYEATAVSGDGSIVVGTCARNLPPVLAGGEIAIIWDSVNGTRNLQKVLTNEYHLDLTGWTLTCATGISADGKTIVGEGTHNGRTEAWIAHLDRPVTEAGGRKAKGK